MIKKTKFVIRNTSENYSSMFQSLKKGKKTEIDFINGKIVDKGKRNNIKTPLNEVLIFLINMLGQAFY
jgi:2-dehydropantoate 2-reductase